MKTLHDKQNNDTFFVPEEGQRGLLCSNKKSFRCPSFGINSNNLDEDMALDYLAGILTKAFLERKKYERNISNNSKESGNIL